MKGRACSTFTCTDIIGAVTRDTFTVVNDPFTAVIWRGACDRTFPR